MIFVLVKNRQFLFAKHGNKIVNGKYFILIVVKVVCVSFLSESKVDDTGSIPGLLDLGREVKLLICSHLMSVFLLGT